MKRQVIVQHTELCVQMAEMSISGRFRDISSRLKSEEESPTPGECEAERKHDFLLLLLQERASQGSPAIGIATALSGNQAIHIEIALLYNVKVCKKIEPL